ncbi:MAG: hypothetical protein NC236_02650 [Mycoplasma sp.]|nr:hypothetical protein [Mycoplasma sp.]
MKKENKRHLWNQKKMAYVSVLIAVSVVFVLIGSMMFAITSFPSFKVAFGGLPVKITGFLFGPIIGGVTGALADILSFIYLPTYYHIAYTIVMALAGIVPGIVVLIFVRIKPNIHIYFWICVGTILSIMAAVVLMISQVNQTTLDELKFPIHNRLALQGITVAGMATMLIATIICRFAMKKENFTFIVPIIVAVVLSEICNDLITPWGDTKVLDVPYIAASLAHIFISPIKMIFNITVIYISLKVIQPLIMGRKENNY